jgi:hypothetical protein
MAIWRLNSGTEPDLRYSRCRYGRSGSVPDLAYEVVKEIAVEA